MGVRGLHAKERENPQSVVLVMISVLAGIASGGNFVVMCAFILKSLMQVFMQRMDNAAKQIERVSQRIANKVFAKQAASLIPITK